MSEPDPELPQDLLRGADEIAKSLYGSSADRRKLYHLAATLNLPIFEPGSMIRARNVVHLRLGIVLIVVGVVVALASRDFLGWVIAGTCLYSGGNLLFGAIEGFVKSSKPDR
jgi:hypothetical protein